MRMILIAFALCYGHLSTAQEVDSSYWQSYSQIVELTDSGAVDFSLLDPVVEDFAFFFTAEQHWKRINVPLQFAFLRYLHQQAGVRHLILEGGYCYGYLVNRYLETGDERLLNKVIHNIPVCPDDQISLFNKIRAYNRVLPKADRIEVTGIDIEHSPELVLQCLSALKPTTTSPASISKQMGRLSSLHHSRYYDEGETRRFFRRLNRDIHRHREAYRSYWGDDLELVEMIIKNTRQGFRFSFIRAALFNKSWQNREMQMYENFRLLSKRLKPGNYYAQFGALHTDRQGSFLWEFPSLANRLHANENSPVREKVLTISRYFRKMADNYEKLGEHKALQELMQTCERAYNTDIVLCSLIGQNSPFPKLSETFQFILLIDSELEKEACE